MLIRLMSIRRSRPISMTDLKRPLLAPTVKRSCSFFRSTARVSSNTQSASGAPTWLRPRSLPSATTEAATPPSISANSAASVFNSMVPPLQLGLPICAPRRRGGASRSLLNTNKLWVLLGVLWRLGRLPPSPPYGGDLGRKGLGRLKGHPVRWHRARAWRLPERRCQRGEPLGCSCARLVCGLRRGGAVVPRFGAGEKKGRQPLSGDSAAPNPGLLRVGEKSRTHRIHLQGRRQCRKGPRPATRVGGAQAPEAAILRGGS